jgi:TRAP-type mannitol/chloroaromatic compound transport system substrate-binding protein
MKRKRFKIFRLRVAFVLPLAALFFMAAIAGIAPGVEPADAADKVFKWRMQDIWGPETFYHKANIRLVDRLREMSNGRLDIQMFPNGALVAARSSFDSVRKGVFQGHISCPAYWAGKIPVATL